MHGCLVPRLRSSVQHMLAESAHVLKAHVPTPQLCMDSSVMLHACLLDALLCQQ